MDGLFLFVGTTMLLLADIELGIYLFMKTIKSNEKKGSFLYGGG